MKVEVIRSGHDDGWPIDHFGHGAIPLHDWIKGPVPDSGIQYCRRLETWEKVWNLFNRECFNDTLRHAPYVVPIFRSVIECDIDYDYLFIFKCDANGTSSVIRASL